MTKQRWRIDDSSTPGHIFCEHLEEPRLIGELLPHENTPEDAEALAAPGNRWLTNIRWLEDRDSYYFEEQDMYDSLAEALATHEAAKASNGSLQRTASGASIARR